METPDLPLEPRVDVELDGSGELAAVSVFVFEEGNMVDDAYLQIDVMPADAFALRMKDDFPAFFAPKVEDGHHAYLSGMELPEKLRGGGLGSQMLSMADLVLRGLSPLHLWTVADSRDAERFYRRFGFRPIKRVGWYSLLCLPLG